MAIKKISEFTAGMLADGDKIIVENPDGTPKCVEYVHREYPVKAGEYLAVDDTDFMELARGNYTFKLATSAEPNHPNFTLNVTSRQIQVGSSGNIIQFYFKNDTIAVGSDAYVLVANGQIQLSESTANDGVTCGYFIIEGFRQAQTVFSKAQTPTISESDNFVTISSTESDTSFKYRIGESGTFQSYTGPFSITSTVTVYAYAEKDGCMPSDTVSEECTYTQPTPKCATPVISQNGNNVTFTCSTAGATIHYSGCGKSGTCQSGFMVVITQSGTMTAYATASGYTQSDTASKSCTYSAPLATPDVSINSIDIDTGNLQIFIDNKSSYPSGTIFEVELHDADGGTISEDNVSYSELDDGGFVSITNSDIKNYPWSNYSEGVTVQVWVRASCSGYVNSETGYSSTLYVPAPTPTLPTPVVNITQCERNFMGSFILDGEITNFSSFPSGTSFSISVYNVTQGETVNGSWDVDDEGIIDNALTPVYSVAYGDTIRVTATASCSGYNSSSGSDTAVVTGLPQLDAPQVTHYECTASIGATFIPLDIDNEASYPENVTYSVSVHNVTQNHTYPNLEFDPEGHVLPEGYEYEHWILISHTDDEEIQYLAQDGDSLRVTITVSASGYEPSSTQFTVTCQWPS